MEFSNKVYILKLEGINKTFKIVKIKNKMLVSYRKTNLIAV